MPPKPRILIVDDIKPAAQKAPWMLHLLAISMSLLSVTRCNAQEKTSSEEPDYRPRVEVQHADFAAARAQFKTQIRRGGPPPAQ
jgi:hypothetical protein